MKKTCDNCTYLYTTHDRKYFCVKHSYIEDKPTKVCETHKHNCMNDYCRNEAAYVYKDKVYCFDCLINKFNIEEHVTTVYYNEDGEYLGSSEEVIKNLSNDIETL